MTTELASNSGRRARWIPVGLLVLAAAWLLVRVSEPPTRGLDRLFFGLWRTRDFGIALLLVWAAVGAYIRGRSRRAFFRFVALNLGGLVTWMAVEAVVVAGLVALPAKQLEPGTARVPHLDVTGEIRENVAARWGIPSEPIPYHFRTDGRGFRNQEDRDEADIYCLGDSFLVAGLIPVEETIAARIEAATGRPTMNVALVGLSPQKERELFEAQSFPLEGRLLLHFIFEGNDLQDSRAYLKGAAGPAEKGPPPLSQRLLLPRLIVKLQRITQPRLAYVDEYIGRLDGEEYLFRYTGNDFAGLDGELSEITSALDALRAHVEAGGGTYAVVMTPSKFRVLGQLVELPEDSRLRDYAAHCSPLPEHVSRWAADSGVPYLDLTPILQDYAVRGEIPWFPGDTHWNGTGNRGALEAFLAWEELRDFFEE